MMNKNWQIIRVWEKVKRLSSLEFKWKQNVQLNLKWQYEVKIGRMFGTLSLSYRSIRDTQFAFTSTNKTLIEQGLHPI